MTEKEKAAVAYLPRKKADNNFAVIIFSSDLQL